MEGKVDNSIWEYLSGQFVCPLLFMRIAYGEESDERTISDSSTPGKGIPKLTNARRLDTKLDAASEISKNNLSIPTSKEKSIGGVVKAESMTQT